MSTDDKKLKAGRFTLEETAHIKQCVGKQSLEDIAKELNRNVKSLIKFVYRHNLVESSRGVSSNNRDVLKETLLNKSYWGEIEKQFSVGELRYFVETWVDFMMQFNQDVLASEELQIKQCIALDILMNRSMSDRQKHIKEIDKLDMLIRSEYEKESGRNNELLSHLHEQINFARSAISTFTREHTALSKEATTIMKNLKATRDQRLNKIEETATTFEGLVRMLNDEKILRTAGEELEIMRFAKDEAFQQLSEYHTYVDNEADRPLLTSKTVEMD